MFALCVDDERLPLQALVSALKKSPDIDGTAAFEDEREALEWAQTHDFDLAFLDIQLHDMTGLELAKMLRARHPRAGVVFCTGYGQYAVEVLGMHIDAGYLVKPCRPAQIQAEIDHAKLRMGRAKRLRVVCFGGFEVYSADQPLRFGRKKSRELLAFLVDRRGALVSAEEACEVLWPGQPYDEKLKDYLYHIMSDLRRTLRNVGQEDILLPGEMGYRVNPDRLDCDYYHFLDRDPWALRAFHGEYMHRYSWAESTCARLQRIQELTVDG